MLGIDGYEPEWQFSSRALAAAHRARFARVLDRPLVDAWLMWDLDGDSWFAGGPVVLGFGDLNVEITHRKFDECAITWGQIDVTTPLDWPGIRLDWRSGRLPELAALRGRTLRQVNVIERIMPSQWRPRVLHAVELIFDGVRLAIHNALDENGISTADEINLPIGFWHRVPIV
ncbi:hypothetical protein J2S43_006885 [Catenuloplanes nepalensis]|uniref:Uncharacterized protein n=1 Tax=Catenuloplanes nepalensis TaxID=587533 RepID=A0ABT9N3T7_9ACTN|nr:hypothetical protein [Catenuloplanes nepalensis]MDP9798373.1 hypothetical protein [Catenuloplanes nepalensis]